MNLSQQLFQQTQVCLAVRFTQLWNMAIFSIKFSLGSCSVATYLRCVGKFLLLLSEFQKFTAKSIGERILRIGKKSLTDTQTDTRMDKRTDGYA